MASLLMLQAQETPTFKTGVTDVRVDVQVVNGKNLVTDLTQRDFSVIDENAPQTLVSFGREAERLSLVLLLDISGSMDKWIDRIAATARESMNFLRPGDKVAILVFGKRMEVHQDFSDNLAESARQIARVREHDVGAGTALNQAIAGAAEYMKKNASPQGRRAILVLTDNLSLSFRMNDETVVRDLDAADTVLNAIVVGRAIRPGPPKPGVYQNPDFTPADVFRLAEETGGDAVRADHPEVSFAQMMERIRTRYSLAYRSPATTAGSFRHIVVRLNEDASRKYPAAEIRARRGYYVAE